MRRALLVGIDRYDVFPALGAPVADVESMAKLLGHHHDRSPNYNCRLLVSRDGRVTRAVLRREWSALLDDFDGEILFYFSGHGTMTDAGGSICTQDGEPSDPGLPMNDILTLANRSRAREVIVILDCCHAGYAGDSPHETAALHGLGTLRNGVTILAASRPKQRAFEVMGQGVFTKLLLDALGGGAADVRGHVTAARMYAHAEQILSPWQQRPMYKAHTMQLSTVRCCVPRVSDEVLRRLIEHFETAEAKLWLAPSYEFTEAAKRDEHVAVFNDLKTLRNGGLIETEGGKDLYFVAKECRAVWLSPQGKQYWQTVKAGRI